MESEADQPIPPIYIIIAESEKDSRLFGGFKYYPYLCTRNHMLNFKLYAYEKEKSKKIGKKLLS
jgi:hypothetical protein